MFHPISSTELTSPHQQPLLGGHQPVAIPPVAVSSAQAAIATVAQQIHVNQLDKVAVIVLSNAYGVGFLEHLQSRIATLVTLRTLFSTAARVAMVGSVAALSVATVAAGGVFHGAAATTHIIEMAAGITGAFFLLAFLYASWKVGEHRKEQELTTKQLDAKRQEGKAEAKTARKILERDELQKNIQVLAWAALFTLIAFFALAIGGDQSTLTLGLACITLGATAGIAFAAHDLKKHYAL